MLGDRVSTMLKTEDVPRTIEWYTRIGFRLRGVFPEAGELTWCELSRDGVVLQFLGGETPWPGHPTFTGTLYFYPESLQALYEEIKDHTPPAWGPEVREWGARELGLRDPDGYFLTFTEDAEPGTEEAGGRRPAKTRLRTGPPSARPHRGRRS